MEKRKGLLVRVGGPVVALVAGAALGFFIYSFVSQYPELSYSDLNRTHPFDSNCRAFATGSDLKTIARVLASLPEPVEEPCSYVGRAVSAN